MRRFLEDGIVARLWPWTRKNGGPNETSPLIPKEDAELDRTTELQRVDASVERRPGLKTTQSTRRSSLTDYFVKYILVLSNLTFSVLGLLLLALGFWGLVSKESFALEKIGSIGTDPMLALAALGLLLATLCLTGCVGALRENSFLLKMFSGILLGLVVAQILAVVLVYNMQAQIGNALRSAMLTAMVRYQDDLDLRFITDEIQFNMQCCGADTYRDWEVNIYYNCSAPGVLACGVPPTCCVDPLENGTLWNSQCGLGAQTLDEFSAQSVIFLGGCLGHISRWLEQHEASIGTVLLVLLVVQILTVFAATRLRQRIR
ncbi:tetraspanin-10 [Stigmatopora nigra]